jgi:hypothetical protein
VLQCQKLKILETEHGLKVSWIPPPEEFYKINIDASFHVNDGHGGWGFVIRN